MAAVQEVQNGAGAEQVAAAPAPVAEASFTGLKPQLLVESPKASDAVRFYKAAFGAVEIRRSMETKRKAELELPLISCSQLEIAASTFLVADLAHDSAAPAKTGGTLCVLCLETEDVEAAVAKAVSAGAVAEGERDEGNGACCVGRVGRKVMDPYGFTWLICFPAKKCGDVESKLESGVEAAVAKAVCAGAVAEGERDEGNGACCVGRVGRKVMDPYGFTWLICFPAKNCGDVESKLDSGLI